MSFSVSFHGVCRSQNFPANVAGIGKNSLEMFGLQVIPHIGTGLMRKNIANSTRILFERVVSDHNVVIKVLRILYLS